MLAYELKNLSYAYQDRPALCVPELDIESGSVTVLVGANGAGKSTLLNLLAFVEAPQSGTILFYGEPLARKNLRRLRHKVGYVPQHPYLLHDSVLANVEIGLRIRGTPRAKRRALVQAALEQLGLAGFAHRPARELSGGEAQKVAIARALALNPEALIFDELFTYLDRQTAAEIENLVLTIREHRAQTVIFSTHDPLRAYALADRVVTLVDGRPGPATLVNLYRGVLDAAAAWFDTGRIRIRVPEGCAPGTHLAIEAAQIVLSREPLHSSMRNNFAGRVLALHQQDGLIVVSVDAGERFQASITRSALQELHLHPGDDVWIGFKSSAIRIF
jgi:tungstate transport system ATP-binding protein